MADRNARPGFSFFPTRAEAGARLPRTSARRCRANPTWRPFPYPSAGRPTRLASGSRKPSRIRQSLPNSPSLPSPILPSSSSIPLSKAISDNLRIERARELFFNTPADRRANAEPYCGKLADESARQLASQWLKRHDEFSPTAMEVLAKCRYRFLLSQLMRLGALRMQEETPDILDRGRLIHRILQAIYASLTGATDDLDASVLRRFAALCKPRAWAAQDKSGSWKIATDRKRTSAGLASTPPTRPDTATSRRPSPIPVSSARRSPAKRCALAIPASGPPRNRKSGESFATMSCSTREFAAEEKRYPALFEFRFGRQPDGETPDMSGPRFADGRRRRSRFTARSTGWTWSSTRAATLSRLLVVIDYKGPGRGGLSEEAYAEEIAQNLNCQLPIYAFAAQQFFFGRHNDSRLNEMTEAVYHIQDPQLRRHDAGSS